MSFLDGILTPGSSTNKDQSWNRYCRKQDEQYYKHVGRKAVRHGLTRFILQVEPLTRHHSELHDDNALTKESITKNPEHARTFSLIKEFFRKKLNLYLIDEWEKELLEDAKRYGVKQGEKSESG